MRHHLHCPRYATAWLLCAVLSPFGVAVDCAFRALPAAAQGVVTEHEGAAAVGLALRRLGTTKRVLMIGAHPDDENTGILSALALGEGADVAYLSLTRGEGGQNGIGPELQEGLGLIRSEELLAARRLDGARQYFTRAYDFGFSRSAEEALRHWPRDSVLADVVAVVRRFRPDVIVSVFSGTPRDGHGQHQVAGIMAREAFEAAADATRFPTQIGKGFLPHRTTYLVQSPFGAQPNAPITVVTGTYDPLLGRSHYQVAMASRSRHRSQDMGQSEPLGPRQSSIRVISGSYPTGARSLFAGVDTTLSAIAAASISQTAVTPGHVEALRRYERGVEQSKAQFNPLAASSLAPALARAHAQLAAVDSIVARGPADLRFALESERRDLEDALWAAAGLVLDVQADDDRVVPGQEFGITVTLWNGGAAPVAVRSLEPRLPEAWQATSQDALAGDPIAPGQVTRRRFRVSLAADARVTEPYFLRSSRTGDLYTWPDDAVRGLPFEPPAVRATAIVVIEGRQVEREGEAAFVEIDKGLGERRRPVLVVPAIAVAVQPTFAVVPLATGPVDNGARATPGPAGRERRIPREIVVQLSSEAPGPLAGTARLEAPAGWLVEPATTAVRFDRTGETRELRFTLRAPTSPVQGEYPVRAVFEATDGRRYDRGYTVIDYPHTRPQPLYRDAVTNVSVFPVAIASGLRIGYIEGAGDDGAEALRQLGATVTLLDSRALAQDDLDRFHTIVLGIRAYEVRQDLIAHNHRLLAYAQNGGTVIAQYNKYEYIDGKFSPYPLTMSRPHGRVTDENAPVRLLDAAHPAMAWPNRITEADFTGWSQERGLYFADTWDDRYTPLLEMADPGEDSLRGGLLVARTGQGWYAYTGLALFRQLPEGVAGAYRLLANLVSLGRRPGS
jgi:LmbE family N-acetylglucosaminyl deacetylase